MTAERFWTYVDKSGDCWLWTGWISKWGYGAARFNGVHQNAHRIAWQIVNGPIETGLVVCHSCDNRRCVNPSHLWLGTQLENMRDAWRKGRRDANCKGDGHHSRRMPERRPRGVTNYNSRFTEDDIRLIRSSADTGGALARRYGVTSAAIYAIRKRKNWAHVV